MPSGQEVVDMGERLSARMSAVVCRRPGTVSEYAPVPARRTRLAVPYTADTFLGAVRSCLFMPDSIAVKRSASALVTASLGVVDHGLESGETYVERQRMAEVAHQLESLGFQVLHVADASIRVNGQQQLFSMLLGVATLWSEVNSRVLPGLSECLEGLIDHVDVCPSPA